MKPHKTYSDDTSLRCHCLTLLSIKGSFKTAEDAIRLVTSICALPRGPDYEPFHLVGETGLARCRFHEYKNYYVPGIFAGCQSSGIHLFRESKDFSLLIKMKCKILLVLICWFWQMSHNGLTESIAEQSICLRNTC